MPSKRLPVGEPFSLFLDSADYFLREAQTSLFKFLGAFTGTGVKHLSKKDFEEHDVGADHFLLW